MKIVYYSTRSGREPAREYLNALPEADRVIIAGDMELIEKHGIFNAPVLTRKIQGEKYKNRLWEIKTGTRHQQRIFYCLEAGPMLVLLHACKKQKSGAQMDDIKTALNRMLEVMA
jgi:phage-related protein